MWENCHDYDPEVEKKLKASAPDWADERIAKNVSLACNESRNSDLRADNKRVNELHAASLRSARAEGMKEGAVWALQQLSEYCSDLLTEIEEGRIKP